MSGSDDEATVAAVGRLTEGLETVERARGHLYSFHQLTGSADEQIADAADRFDAAGHPEVAARLRHDLVGRNVLPDRWTFQVVEEYDDGYWQVVRDAERTVREQLLGGTRHRYEAGLKSRNRTRGHPDHTAGPPGEDRVD